MRLHLRLFATASLMALAPALPATAADYDPPMVVESDLGPIEDYVPVEIGSGWYLRGDIGYAFTTTADGAFNYQTYNIGTGVYGSGTYDSTTVTGGISYGIGFGYAFTDMLRADLTAERFNIRFNGVRTSAQPCAGQPVGTTCRTTDTATMYGTSVMANGYVDLGTFAGFTPYVGAGAGLTHVTWSTISNANACMPGVGVCAAATAATTNPGQTSWRFSYAAMAGLAYDINDSLKFSVGYKYRKINGGPMYGFNAADTAAGASGVQGTDPGFTQHEVKLGLRYEIW
ncbi:MAG: porin family protein [Rhizobiaceae bacterium]|nr:porin family protein [Rhizobiaceae bacterium]